MLAIGLKFPAGRFHATPWGRHVNEGAVEWPPSPWRLLRALVATWKVKAPELEEAQVRAILEQLAAPPAFYLPRATTGHTRHYMRWYKKGPEDQTLVFDAFVCIDRKSELTIQWPEVDLADEHHRALTSLLEGINHLGRAESWCEAQLLTEVKHEPNAFPLKDHSANQSQELVRVLCADPEQAFADEHVVKSKTVGRGKSKSVVKECICDPAWSLCMETAQLHAEKWSDPPGSQWVTYVRSSDCLNPRPISQSRMRLRRPAPQVVRYALDSTVLPLTTETLPVAEHVRSKLMGRYGRMNQCDGVRGRSATLSGKDGAGRPLVGHGHAYYLPTDEDGDGRLDHLTIVAGRGFEPAELKAFDRLRYLKRGDDSPKLNLLLTGMGRLDEFQPLPLHKSQRWVSATPFLVTRYPKKNGRKRDPKELLNNPHAFLQEVLREEVERFLERRGISWSSSDIQIAPIYDDERSSVFVAKPKRWNRKATGPQLRPIQFKRFRSRKSGDDGGRRWAGMFHLIFPEPVGGPICLGHSSHFGLGSFLPESS